MTPRPTRRTMIALCSQGLYAIGFYSLCFLVDGGAGLALAAEGNHTVRVAIHDDHPAASKGPTNLLRFLDANHGFSSKRITSAEIRRGDLSGFDVLIMPGGSGSKQAERLEKEGCRQIREFVRSGGGYVGICAGSYLASSHYDWSLGLINARVWDRANWARGGGEVAIRMTDAGRQFLGQDGSVPVHYNQGPLLVPDDESDLPGYEVLATFETGVGEKGAQKESMTGTHAIIRSIYGQGRVICFSPHPEVSGGPNGLIAAGVRWAGQGRPPNGAGRRPSAKPVSSGG
jgi:glutamine amidotransferase-like uncharacterized protein